MEITIDQYMEEVEGGFVSRRVHPEDQDVVILNYTEKAVYEKRWNEVTLNCRGLIVNEKTGEVLAKPFPKFFNIGENEDYEKDIDFNQTPEFTTKMDGSLGISYILNGRVCWSTRGSFESEQAAVANEIWNKKYSEVKIPVGVTLMVEIIDPRTRIVVDYNGQSDLVLIGATDIQSEKDFDYDQLYKLSKQIGLPVTERQKLTVELAVKLKEEISHNEEGWVLRWPNGKRLKVKGNNYMDVHRIAYGLSDKKKVEFWADGKMNDLILKMPEEFREEIELFSIRLDCEVSNIKYELETQFLIAKHNSNDRKGYAKYVIENVKKEFQGIVFKAYGTNHIDIESIREQIYKNYSQYI